MKKICECTWIGPALNALPPGEWLLIQTGDDDSADWYATKDSREVAEKKFLALDAGPIEKIHRVVDGECTRVFPELARCPECGMYSDIRIMTTGCSWCRLEREHRERKAAYQKRIDDFQAMLNNPDIEK